MLALQQTLRLISNPMNRDAPKPMRGSRVEKAPWQFSLRGLFVITAIVALCLGTGFYFPTAVAVVVACGLAQAAVVLAIDWLIRPARRRSLAVVIPGFWMLFGGACWMLVGGVLLVIGYLQLGQQIEPNSQHHMWLVAPVLMAAGMYCWYFAFRNWRKMTAR